MFDLNQKITKWLNGLGQSEAFEGRDIAELEGHLREEIEHLVSLELTEQEAFLVARQRLGDTTALEDEFAKVNSGHILRNRLFWMVAGLLTCIAASHLSSLALTGCHLLGALGGLLGYNFGLVSEFIGIGVFCFTLVVFCAACRESNTLRLDWLFRTLKGKVILYAAFGVVFVVHPLTEVLSRALGARITSVEQWGQIMLVSKLVRWPFQIFLLVGFIALLIRLRSSNVRAAPE
ncbi:MAG: permease prefix domain 1-containing protein [Planctomycetota bacterium]